MVFNWVYISLTKYTSTTPDQIEWPVMYISIRNHALKFCWNRKMPEFEHLQNSPYHLENFPRQYCVTANSETCFLLIAYVHCFLLQRNIFCYWDIKKLAISVTSGLAQRLESLGLVNLLRCFLFGVPDASTPFSVAVFKAVDEFLKSYKRFWLYSVMLLHACCSFHIVLDFLKTRRDTKKLH